MESLELLFSEGMDVNVSDAESQFTALHYAAREGSKKAIHFLVQNGAEIDRKSFLGWTPLHLAAHNNHYVSCLILLFYGADRNILDNSRLTPLDEAKKNRNNDLQYLLINSEEIIDEMKNHREVFSAVFINDTSRIQQLFESKKLNIDYIDSENQFSFLHNAVGQGKTESVRTLLRLGADPDIVAMAGFTPLMVAVYFNHVHLVKILIQAGANKEKQSESGETAYDLAIQSDNPEIIELLK